MEIQLITMVYHLFFNGTSNGYNLQSVYNGTGFIGIIIDLSQVFLAICDTNAQPFTYTGSEHIDITNNQVSLTCVYINT